MKMIIVRECYSISRSLIDENNGSVGRSWIVFHNGIAPKVTSAAEIQLIFKERSFSIPLPPLIGITDVHIDFLELYSYDDSH